MKEGDCGDGRGEMVAAPAMVSQDSPVLQPGKRVLHAGAAAAMSTPGAITDDPVAAEDRDAEARDTAIPADGEDAVVLEAERLDQGAAEVNGVVAVAGTAGRGGNDTTVVPTNEHLGVT